jgi:hypothetical protein
MYPRVCVLSCPPTFTRHVSLSVSLYTHTSLLNPVRSHLRSMLTLDYPSPLATALVPCTHQELTREPRGVQALPARRYRRRHSGLPNPPHCTSPRLSGYTHPNMVSPVTPVLFPWTGGAPPTVLGAAPPFSSLSPFSAPATPSRITHSARHARSPRASMCDPSALASPSALPTAQHSPHLPGPIRHARWRSRVQTISHSSLELRGGQAGGVTAIAWDRRVHGTLAHLVDLAVGLEAGERPPNRRAERQLLLEEGLRAGEERSEVRG